jgi:hypothetical protein
MVGLEMVGLEMVEHIPAWTGRNLSFANRPANPSTPN